MGPCLRSQIQQQHPRPMQTELVIVNMPVSKDYTGEHIKYLELGCYYYVFIEKEKGKLHAGHYFKSNSGEYFFCI